MLAVPGAMSAHDSGGALRGREFPALVWCDATGVDGRFRRKLLQLCLLFALPEALRKRNS
jgi:hypothetical protein